MSKKSCFRRPCDKKHGKLARAQLKSAPHPIDQIHSSLATKLRAKKDLLLTCQILGQLVNALATNEKYPVVNGDNLTIPIHMQLSQKQKKSRLDFKLFGKKDDPRAFWIFEVTDSENVVR